MRPWPVPAALVAVAVLALSACGGGDSGGSTSGGDGTAAGRVVEVRMLAARRFQPDSIAVRAGETVTFRVINKSDAVHEFVLGDEARQAEREREMTAMGSGPMEMDDERDLVNLKGGATEELTWTFAEPGTVLYGCHQPGHYAAGMKGTITVS